MDPVPRHCKSTGHEVSAEARKGLKDAAEAARTKPLPGWLRLDLLCGLCCSWQRSLGMVVPAAGACDACDRMNNLATALPHMV